MEGQIGGRRCGQGDRQTETETGRFYVVGFEGKGGDREPRNTGGLWKLKKDKETHSPQEPLE